MSETVGSATVVTAAEPGTATELVQQGDGGYVTIHGPSLADGDTLGSVAGTSAYPEPGTHENAPVAPGRVLLVSSRYWRSSPWRCSRLVAGGKPRFTSSPAVRFGTTTTESVICFSD